MLRENCFPLAVCYMPNTIVEEPEQCLSLKREMRRQSTHSILSLCFLDVWDCKLCKNVFQKMLFLHFIFLCERLRQDSENINKIML